VIEKRRVPEGNQTMVEYSAKVVSSTEDSAGEILSQKVSFELIARYPVNGLSTDVDAALVIFRDLVAGDELTNSVSTQEWL
jgi:protein involved in ribonucleotide reduction